MQDEARIIWVLGFGASYIREFTVFTKSEPSEAMTGHNAETNTAIMDPSVYGLSTFEYLHAGYDYNQSQHTYFILNSSDYSFVVFYDMYNINTPV